MINNSLSYIVTIPNFYFKIQLQKLWISHIFFPNSVWRAAIRSKTFQLCHINYCLTWKTETIVEQSSCCCMTLPPIKTFQFIRHLNSEQQRKLTIYEQNAATCIEKILPNCKMRKIYESSCNDSGLTFIFLICWFESIIQGPNTCF